MSRVNGLRSRERNWMHLLCRPSHEKIAKPFSESAFGLDWDVATNGQAMLLVAGPCAFGPAKQHMDIEKAMHQTNTTMHRGVPFALLREWAFEPHPCEDCAGTGWVVRHCEEEFVCHCRDGYTPFVVGALFGRLINRQLLWQYLSFVRADHVDVVIGGGVLEAVHILARGVTPEWRVVLMPVRGDDDDSAEEFSDYLRACAEAAE